MLQLLLRLVSTMGTVITAASVASTSGQQPAPWVRAAMVALIALALYVTVADVIKDRAAQPKRYGLNSPDIVAYMTRWLGSGGRAAVFSRDLSWAAGGPPAELLEAKAPRAA